jgi:hypothetical protein
VRKKLAALVAAALMAVPVLSGSQAQALTAWQNFGLGFGRGVGTIGRDSQGNLQVDQIVVYVESTTKRDPARLRFRIRGQGRAGIAWYLTCWNGANDTANVGTRDDPIVRVRRLPFTLNLSDRLGGVRNWERCSLGVAVASLREGTVRLFLQSRYG